jgi:hypothetical protein
MRFIPTVLHGVLDYIVGLVIVALPFLLGWPPTARNLFVAAGLTVLIYSVCTDYELGVWRYLRIRFHLLLDAIFGLAMLASPTVLNLPADHRAAVYAIGVIALLLVITTKVRAEGTRLQADI